MPNTEIHSTKNEAEVAAPQIDRAPTRKRRASTKLAAQAPAAALPPKERASKTKTEIVLAKLKSAKGATIQTLMDATGWQAHSVRGFLSGTVRKKLGLNLVNEIGKDGQRYYRIDSRAKAE
jgi:hypothetical protein